MFSVVRRCRSLVVSGVGTGVLVVVVLGTVLCVVSVLTRRCHRLVKSGVGTAVLVLVLGTVLPCGQTLS